MHGGKSSAPGVLGVPGTDRSPRLSVAAADELPCSAATLVCGTADRSPRLSVAAADELPCSAVTIVCGAADRSPGLSLAAADNRQVSKRFAEPKQTETKAKTRGLARRLTCTGHTLSC